MSSHTNLDTYLAHMTDPENTRATGFTITEDEMCGMLKERLYLAQGLPRAGTGRWRGG